MPLAMIYLVILLFAAYFAKGLVSSYSRYKGSIAILQNYPGIRVCFHPHTIFSLLPRIPYINLGSQYIFRNRYKLFSSRGTSDVLSLVSFFPAHRMFLIADPVSTKHITADRVRYQKPLGYYRPLSQYGDNVGVTEGDVWRRHRKIVTGSFSEKTNQLAWDETARVIEDCINDWHKTASVDSNGKLVVKVDNIVDLTLKIGLFVICAAAFSQRPQWNDEEKDQIPKGHKLSFRSTMNGVLEGVMINIFTPKWVYKFPINYFRHTQECYQEFTAYLHETIAARKAVGATGSDIREGEEGRKDLLGALVYASAEADDEDGEEDDKGSDKKRVRLSDAEVVGNIYVFLLAGHETTAHTLAFTLPLLALYQEKQEKLFEHIDKVLPKDVEPSFEDFSKLTLVTATFMETLRLYPSVVVIPKTTMVDTVIPTAPNSDGTPSEKIFIPKWTDVFIDAVALHRNPKYWGDDCNDFKPERFLDAEDGSYKWPRDCFMGFSSGHRSCLGQKFGTVESVAVIALLLRKYSIHLPEDLDGSGEKRRKKGETFEEKVERVMKCGTFITLTPQKTGLVFKER